MSKLRFCWVDSTWAGCSPAADLVSALARVLRCLPIGLLWINACNMPLDSKARSAAKNPTAKGKSDSSRVSAAGGATAASSSHSSLPSLRVNGDRVEPSEMWADLSRELEAKAAELSSDAYRAYVEQRAAQWIGDKIAERLVFQKASLRLTEGMGKNIDRYVDGEVRKIVTRDHGGVQRRYEKHLASRGQTIEEVRAKLRREVIISNFLETEVRPRLAEPTRTDLVAAFDAGGDTWRKPARHRMSLIEVRMLDHLPLGVDQPTREQQAAARAEAREKIQEAQGELRLGTPFADVARKHSTDLHAPDGGAWGWVSPGSVRERYEPVVKALYGLRKGQVSEIIESPEGFFLVRCDDEDPGVEPRFEDVQAELKEHYTRAAYQAFMNELVRDLRGQARIEPDNLNIFHAAVVEATLRQSAQNTH